MTADGCCSWKYNWRSDCTGNDRANSSKVIGRQGHDKLVADTRRLLRATWNAMRCWPRPLCMVYATLKSSSSPTRQKSLGNFVRCCRAPLPKGMVLQKRRRPRTRFWIPSRHARLLQVKVRYVSSSIARSTQQPLIAQECAVPDFHIFGIHILHTHSFVFARCQCELCLALCVEICARLIPSRNAFQQSFLAFRQAMFLKSFFLL